jgi:hypothetical protein
MKRLFPALLMVMGIAFLAAGAYTVNRRFDAKDEVKSELIAQDITTPDDASIPGVRVDSVATARSMADIIDHHMREATNGETYAEMGRFLAADGTETNDASLAQMDANGNPVANPLRNVAFQASSLRTSLFSSVMAFEIANLVIGLGALLAALGIAVGGLGFALEALTWPTFAKRFHVTPPVTPVSV